MLAKLTPHNINLDSDRFLQYSTKERDTPLVTAHTRSRPVGASVARYRPDDLVELPEPGRVAIVERAVAGAKVSATSRAESGGMQVSGGYLRFRFSVILIFINKNYLGREEHGECLR